MKTTAKNDPKDNRPSFPQRVVVELTPRCNLSCSMCPRHYIDVHDGYMTEKLWTRLIDEISERSPQSVILPFWRGESLLHPDFVKFVEYAMGRSLRVHISTNGHLVTKEYAGVLARCEFVTFSVHSQVGFVHAQEFLSLKKKNKPFVQISFVKGEHTEKYLHELISKQDLGGFDSVRLYDEHSKDGVFGKSGHAINLSRGFCPKLLDTFVVAFEGTMSRCNHIWKTEQGINLNDMKIQEVWESERLRQIRRGYPDNFCTPCDQWTGHTCGESWRMVDGKIDHNVFGSIGAFHE